MKTFKPVHTLYIESDNIKDVIFSGELLHVITQTSHCIYRNYKFERLFKLEAHCSLAVNFPLQVTTEGDSMVTMRILGSDVKEHIRVPERMGGIVLPEEDEEGLLFMWGLKSRAIYCWRIKARNLPRIEDMSLQ
jgi:hypothetical protein